MSRPGSASSNRQSSEARETEKAGAVVNVVDVSSEDPKPAAGESSAVSPCRIPTYPSSRVSSCPDPAWKGMTFHLLAKGRWPGQLRLPWVTPSSLAGRLRNVRPHHSSSVNHTYPNSPARDDCKYMADAVSSFTPDRPPLPTRTLRPHTLAHTVPRYHRHPFSYHTHIPLVPKLRPITEKGIRITKEPSTSAYSTRRAHALEV